MEYKKFEDKKAEFDLRSVLYFTKQFLTPIKDSDAFKEGIIDGIGNSIKPVTKETKWAFTPFDKLLLAIKQTIGEEKINALLKDLSWISEFDSLFIINLKSSVDFNKIKNSLKMIVSRVESYEYLPDDLEYSEEYLDDYHNFCDRASSALTKCNMLMYALIDKKMPSSVDFTHNVIPSVELTFNVRADKDYEKCVNFLKSNKLMNFNDITQNGIKFLHSVSSVINNSDLLNDSRDRIENLSRYWKKITTA